MAVSPCNSASDKPMNVPAIIEFNRSQLLVIRQMCAKDCTDSEYNLFLEMCRGRGQNPLLKHIYAMVLHKDSKDKRQLTIIVSVDGQRVIANRTKNYRPDSRTPRFETDPDLVDHDTNPVGLISVEVSVYTYMHGGWHEVPSIAYYDEYAPLIDEWKEDESTGQRFKTGRLILDPKKPMWRRRARAQLAKCAEVGALRKAFPDDFGGIYAEEEMDRAHSLDLTASEILAEAAKEHRQEMLGGPGVMMDWMSGGPLEKVSFGQFFDRSMEFLRTAEGSPATIKSWEDRNRVALREFWGHSKGDADELKRQIEKAKITTLIPEAEPVAKPKKAKTKEVKTDPDAKDQVLPKLRLRLDQAEKPEGASDVLRHSAKSLRELAREPAAKAGQPRTSSGVATGKGKAPRSDDQ
jgi:phage recombination protein Bet